MDIRLALMSGIDIPIPECQLILSQPKIKDIALIGELSFFVGVQCLTINKSAFAEDESLLENTSNFQVFMTVMTSKDTVEKKQDTLSVLTLQFPEYKILFTPRALLFQKDGHSTAVDDNNFESLQNIIKQIFCSNGGGHSDQTSLIYRQFL